jgi:O-antigen/teichoic acid export membrane protein
MKPLLYSALARILSLVPTALATLLASRLIINHFGLSSFDSYALVISLMQLLPLNDLGVGAAVTSAFAARGPRDPFSERVTLTAARTLALSTAGLLVAAALLTGADLWPRLLGHASGSNAFVGLAVVVYALSFLPGLGQSMLLGANRNHVAIAVQAFLAPLTLVAVVILIALDFDGRLVMVAPAAALVVINAVNAVVSSTVTRFSWTRLLRELPRPHRYPGASIRAISGPMLVITLAMPIAFYTDRIVLSHVSTLRAVADYSVVMQVFAPVAALIAAAAQPLWPMYTRARSQGKRGPQLGRVIIVLGLGALLANAVLVVAANPIGHLIGGDQIQLGLLIPISCALAVAAQAAAYPVAMSLMDPQGLRFVGTCTVLSVPLNLGLSIVLAKHYGAAGPLLATFAVGLLVQTLPGLIYARNRESVGRHRYRPRRAAANPAEAHWAAMPSAADAPTAPLVALDNDSVDKVVGRHRRSAALSETAR